MVRESLRLRGYKPEFRPVNNLDKAKPKRVKEPEPKLVVTPKYEKPLPARKQIVKRSNKKKKKKKNKEPSSRRFVRSYVVKSYYRKPRSE